MKYLIIGVVVVCLLLSGPWGLAAPAAKTSLEKTGGAKAQPQATHADLARVLVNVLGLARFLPPNPTDQERFAILLDNGIVPKGGWKPDAEVTRADLARVVVQALKRQGDIKNPDDDKEWVDYVKSLGIPIDSIGEASYYIEPLAEPIARNVVSARTDPLLKRHRFNPIDETQYGVDMESIARVFSRFEFTAGEFRPKPVTPD